MAEINELRHEDGSPIHYAGRADLLRMLDALHAENGRLRRECAELNSNLTSVQARCTEQLEELRQLRVFAPLAHGLERARRLHPEGSSFADLLDEVAELARELGPAPNRIVQEAHDVAIVALRIALGGDRRESP